MLKMFIVFLCMWGFIFFGFKLFSITSRDEKIKFVKLFAYSGGCAIIALVVLSFVVILF